MEDATTRVVAVAAGEAHTLLLTGDGGVYSWGRGTLGRLGLGYEQDELFPVQVKFGSSGDDFVKIVGIAAGAYHSLALADDGSVWCWGYNLFCSTMLFNYILDYCMDGQLGIINGGDSHNRDYSLVPSLLNKFLELHPPNQDSSTVASEAQGKASLKILSVKAGGMMSLAIDNLGALWMWGNCPQQSKEGNFSIVTYFTPTPIWYFHGHTVVKVACGNEHVIALVSAEESYNDENDLICYSWGNNNHGQLGLGDKDNRPNPQVIKTFDQKSPWLVYELSCGAFHTALLTKRKKPNETLESVCWTFGLGDNGQLGHGTTQTTSIPEPVKELPQSVYLVSVDCGLFHTCVVSSIGDVWSWGMEKGLGLYPDARTAGEGSGDALFPLLITCDPYQPRFLEPVQVACGAAHTIIVAQGGYKLWSWGRGRSGVLGNGKALDCYTPTLVLWPPLVEDFKEEKPLSSRKTKGITETDEKLSSLDVNELKQLKSKLSMMERYVSELHGFIFGKPFDEQDMINVSLRNSGGFNIEKEWENMLEVVDYSQLVKMELHYRKMHACVKDKLVKKRIKEIAEKSLKPSEMEN